MIDAMSMYPQLLDAAWLRQRYDVEGQTREQIAGEIGCCANSVGNALRKHDIKTRKHITPPTFHPGDKVGRLTIVRQVGVDGATRRYECLCECGATTTARSGNLRSGNVKSCGCLAREWAPQAATKVARERSSKSFSEIRTAAQRMGRFTIRALAEEVGMSVVQVRRHLRRLEQTGAITQPHYEWRFSKPEAVAERPTGSDARVAGWKRAGATSGNRDMPADKDMRQLVQQAVAAGASISRTGGDHFAIRKNGSVVTVANTPSSSRAVDNAKADMKRAGIL